VTCIKNAFLDPRRPATLPFTALMVLSMILAVLLWPQASGATDKAHVLVLNSYHPGLQSGDNIVKGISTTFAGQAMPVSFHIEYLDAERINDPFYFLKLYDIYKYKFFHRQFDVIIASDDPALRFLLEYAADLFGNTPVVFCGINYFEDYMLAEHPHFTGILETPDIKKTLALAMNLHPQLEEIIIINDSSQAGRVNRSVIDRIISDWGDTYRFHLIDNIDMASLLEKVASLEDSTIVLWVTFSRDNNDQVVDPKQSTALIAENYTAPIYGLRDISLGHGIVGGKLISGMHQGKAAAQIALRILQGESVHNIPIVKQSPNQWMFDYQQLKRFNIDVAALPANSTITNRQESVYEKNAKWIWALAVIFCIQALVIILLAFNTQMRLKAERAFKRIEGILKATLNSTRDGILVVTKDGSISHANAKFADIWSIPTDKLPSKNGCKLMDHLLPQRVDPESFAAKIKRIEKSAAPDEDIIKLKDGRIIERYAAPLLYQTSETGTVWFYRDITKHRQADDALKKNQDRLKRAQSMAHVGNWELDLQTGFLWGSEEARKIYGFDTAATQITFKDIQCKAHPIDRAHLDRAIDDLLTRNKNFDVEFRIFKNHDGSFRWVHSKAEIELNDQGDAKRLLGTIQDITKRKVVEDRAQENKALFETFMNNLPALAYMKDMAGRYLYCNQTCQSTYKKPLTDIIGKTDDEIWPEKIAATIKSNDNIVMSEGEAINIVETYETESETRHHLVSKFPIHKNGMPSIIAGVAIDITDRIRAEEEKEQLELQLTQAQKMEAIGTLAGGIAHDFNNILQAISGYAQLMLLDKNVQDPEVMQLQEIVRAARNASDLTRQLLTFSRKVDSRLKPTQLNHEVLSIKNVLARTLPKMISIDLQLATDLKEIQCDRTQIGQVLMNLGINASHAMPEGGRLLFSTANVQLDDAFCRNNLGAKPGSYNLLTVADTGSGMDEETLNRIYEPFFTTKKVGQGTGLGLAIVYGIIKNHGGYILCHSALGQGTEFKIFLPTASSRGTEPRESLHRIPDLLKGNETVLLVDDDHTIINFSRDLLTRFGYQIKTACSGEEALKLFKYEHQSIDLVILDVNMPGMGGPRCLTKLRKINPDTKVLIASGYSPNASLRKTLDAGACGFIGKPYQIADLLKKARDVIEESN
jgi:PAS domain S-box-containing protein